MPVSISQKSIWAERIELLDVVDTRKLTHAGLEEYAKEVFVFHDVARLITNAARRGEHEVRVRQDSPVDIQDTDAANKLSIRLSQLGYKFEWQKVSQKEVIDRRDTDRYFVYWELAIIWLSVLSVG